MYEALGTGDDLAHSSIRFGIGDSIPRRKWITSPTEWSRPCNVCGELSPLYEMAKEGVDLKSVKWAAEAH